MEVCRYDAHNLFSPLFEYRVSDVDALEEFDDGEVLGNVDVQPLLEGFANYVFMARLYGTPADHANKKVARTQVELPQTDEELTMLKLRPSFAWLVQATAECAHASVSPLPAIALDYKVLRAQRSMQLFEWAMLEPPSPEVQALPWNPTPVLKHLFEQARGSPLCGRPLLRLLAGVAHLPFLNVHYHNEKCIDSKCDVDDSETRLRPTTLARLFVPQRFMRALRHVVHDSRRVIGDDPDDIHLVRWLLLSELDARCFGHHVFGEQDTSAAHPCELASHVPFNELRTWERLVVHHALVEWLARLVLETGVFGVLCAPQTLDGLGELAQVQGMEAPPEENSDTLLAYWEVAVAVCVRLDKPALMYSDALWAWSLLVLPMVPPLRVLTDHREHIAYYFHTVEQEALGDLPILTANAQPQDLTTPFLELYCALYHLYFRDYRFSRVIPANASPYCDSVYRGSAKLEAQFMRDFCANSFEVGHRWEGVGAALRWVRMDLKEEYRFNQLMSVYVLDGRCVRELESSLKHANLNTPTQSANAPTYEQRIKGALQGVRLPRALRPCFLWPLAACWPNPDA